jgi:hypothetical protein
MPQMALLCYPALCCLLRCLLCYSAVCCAACSATLLSACKYQAAVTVQKQAMIFFEIYGYNSPLLVRLPKGQVLCPQAYRLLSLPGG